MSEALADAYRLTEVPVLDTDYTERDEEAGRRRSATARRRRSRYRHLVGRLDPSARAPRRRAAGAGTAAGARTAPATRASCSA